MNGKILGERLVLLRNQQNMRQATLARKMGITPNGLNLLEHGSINDPHISRVITAAKIFQVSADFLLGLSDDPLPAGLLFAREGPLALQ